MTINDAIQEMQALTNSENAWLREKANKVIRYNHQHETGQLSTAEYTDLLKRKNLRNEAFWMLFIKLEPYLTKKGVFL